MSSAEPTNPQSASRRRSHGSLFFSDSDLDHSCLTSDEDDELDLESGQLEFQVHSSDKEAPVTNCRICHLSLSSHDVITSDDYDGAGGGDDVISCELCEAIVLGCDCKGDLGTAHKHCAETWFKIRGNSTCEICGAIACNVGVENNTIEMNGLEMITTDFPSQQSEPQPEWCTNQQMLHFLIVLCIIGFIVSWLFHLHVLASS